MEVRLGVEGISLGSGVFRCGRWLPDVEWTCFVFIWCNDKSMSETGRADSISINSTIQPFYQSFAIFEPLTPGIVPLHATNAQRT